MNSAISIRVRSLIDQEGEQVASVRLFDSIQNAIETLIPAARSGIRVAMGGHLVNTSLSFSHEGVKEGALLIVFPIHHNIIKGKLIPLHLTHDHPPITWGLVNERSDWHHQIARLTDLSLYSWEMEPCGERLLYEAFRCDNKRFQEPDVVASTKIPESCAISDNPLPNCFSKAGGTLIKRVNSFDF